MAVPNPQDELTRLERLLAKGLPPVVLVTGPSDFFRAAAVDRLLTAVPPDAELRTVDAVEERAGGGGGGGGEDDDADDDGDEAVAEDGGAAALAACPELQDLRGGGLFARRAFVVVRRGTNWWKKHAVTLAGQVARIASGCGFVLEAAKLDKRKKLAAGLVKSLGESGNVFDFRYRMGVARSTSPTGPFTKKSAPILASSALWAGPGHGSVVRAHGKDLLVHHAWHALPDGTPDGERGRVALITPIEWKDGWPVLGAGTPSDTAIAYP